MAKQQPKPFQMVFYHAPPRHFIYTFLSVSKIIPSSNRPFARPLSKVMYKKTPLPRHRYINNNNKRTLPRPPKRMRLRIQHPLIQRHHVRLGKQQPKIFQRLRQPKALHAIRPGRMLVRRRHVVDGRVPALGARRADDRLEHAPPALLPDRVASDAVHVPN